ncbi:chemotaxis protein CheA [Pseudomonadota bacterium]
MSIDEGLQAYIQETTELLDQAEDTLLSLEDNPTDEALINELFRAVHTIKGASGLFGYDDVVAFTHEAESVMGQVREGKLTICSELLSLFLKCRDHIGTLVQHALSGEAELDADTQATGKVLMDELCAYLGHEPSSTSASSDAAATASEEAAEAGPNQVESDTWHISLRFGPDVLRNGMDPLSFFRYLETVGDIVNLTTLDDAMPVAEDMDAESCYLGFEIDLRSDTDKETIEGVFEFVQDDCEIHILSPNTSVAQYARLIEELPEENLRIGEILTLSGALTARELKEALDVQTAIEHQEGEGDEAQAVPPLGEVVVAQQVVAPKVVEAALEKQQNVKQAKSLDSQAVRVNAGKLEDLINLVGELVIASAHSQVMALQTTSSGMLESVENMSRLVEEIRDNALGLRMVQIGETFNRYRRVVRELSKEVGKDIELSISGGDTELDKTVVERITDPLMHLVRNSIDHGIESPEVRAANGKPAKSTISLNAFHESGSIIIEVIDDGGGLPRDVILAKAIERGLASADQTLTDQEVFHLIFEPGFSTAEKVTNISGRGVGMDVVRKNIDALRGLIEVTSTPGVETKFSIRLPLTLAIIDGFQVRVGDSTYIIPLAMVEECTELEAASSRETDGSNYINLRGELLPFVKLGEMFSLGQSSTQNTTHATHRDNIVVVQFGSQRAGLVVDELLGEYQTVIKPLGDVFQHLKGFSGATILGSGEVAMIVDVPGLIEQVAHFSTMHPKSGINHDKTISLH